MTLSLTCWKACLVYFAFALCSGAHPDEEYAQLLDSLWNDSDISEESLMEPGRGVMTPTPESESESDFHHF